MTQELVINGIGKSVKCNMVPYDHQWKSKDEIITVIDVLTTD